MKKARIISAVTAALLFMSVSGTVFADETDEWGWSDGPEYIKYVNGSFGELNWDSGYSDGYYDGYDLKDYKDKITWSGNTFDKGLYIRFNNARDPYYPEIYRYYDYSDAIIRIPDTINGEIVSGIKGSCEFKEFDLNPDNKHMKCVDNVIFSSDGKTLMSFAQYDDRTEYIVPEGTEIIGEEAFKFCRNLKKVIIPDTVTEIGAYAFSSSGLEEVILPSSVETITKGCFECFALKSMVIPENSKLNSLESNALYSVSAEITLPSFDIEIDKAVFGSHSAETEYFKSYVKPDVSANGKKITWDKIPNASYYEVYQKLRNGEYKLLRRTRKTETVFDTLKPGYTYTFAVKAYAKKQSERYDPERDEREVDGRIIYSYPKYFVIEGTMSEDVVVTGK